MITESMTIDDILDELTQIIDKARQDGNKLGYFAALYRRVTIEIKNAIRDHYFDDGERMERLDVVFARRYLDALRDWQTRKPVTLSWKLAFEASSRWQPIVFQHLLVAMNAHINLDLAIAAAEVSPGPSIYTLESDFTKVNAVLGSLTDIVQEQLERCWPGMKKINRVAGAADDAVLNFSMRVARRVAWNEAIMIALAEGQERANYIARLDRQTARLGRRILSPGLALSMTTLMIRFGEQPSVRKNILTLEN